MKEADSDGLDALLTQLLRCPPHGGLVQRDEHVAPSIQPFGYAEAEVARDQRRRLLKLQVVERWPCLAGDLQHVPEAIRGDEAGPSDLPFDDRICGHGGTVYDVGHILRGQAGLMQHAPDSFQEANGRVCWGGRDLADVNVPCGLVYESGVGEGATDVYS